MERINNEYVFFYSALLKYDRQIKIYGYVCVFVFVFVWWEYLRLTLLTNLKLPYIAINYIHHDVPQIFRNYPSYNWEFVYFNTKLNKTESLYTYSAPPPPLVTAIILSVTLSLSFSFGFHMSLRSGDICLSMSDLFYLA